jgi:hypothetical protein
VISELLSVHGVSTCYIMTGQSRDPSELPPSAQPLIQIGAKSLDLAWEVNDFKTHTIDWEMFDDALNALCVVHTRK